MITTLNNGELDELRELLAEIEHIQWWTWTMAIEKDVEPNRVMSWKNSRIPYSVLPEFVKTSDRCWADVVIELLMKKQIIKGDNVQ